MSRYYRTILNVQGGAINPDAQAFLTATGITDATIKSAINNLVVSLKSDGLWAKMKAIYPFVGGTAGAHKFNLKDPRDLDAAFRITWFGGVTHSANGVQGNGTNGYGNTHLDATDFAQNDFFGAGYSRTTPLFGVDTIFGVFGGGTNNGLQLTPSFSGNFNTRCQTTGSSNTFNADTSGFLGLSRTTSTEYLQIIRETNHTKTVASVAPASGNLAILALNNNGLITQYARNEMASYYFGEGLTPTQITAIRTIDATFQTALSRNV